MDFGSIAQNWPLLERVTIALVAVLLVSALVGVIKYDMQRTAASQRAGMNSVPTAARS